MTSPREELSGLARLSAPLVAGFLGNQLMGVVATAMVGRLGAAAIGGVGIGGSVYLALSLVAMGCTLGMDPLVTQALGAGEAARARRILWQGLRVALGASIPIAVLILLAPRIILAPLRVDAETARATQEYLLGRAPNTVAFALFAALRSYLQAVGSTRPIIVCTIVANIVNFFGDALLIYGDRALGWVGLPAIGIPALGVFGAGIASSLSALGSLLVLVAAVRAVPTPADPGRRLRDAVLMKQIFRLGMPVGLQMLIEVSAFAAASILSGRIGATAAAGNQVALTLAASTYMVPQGISAATAVRVGHAVGAGDTARARLAGLCGYFLSLCFMTLAALAFTVAPGPLARVLTNKPDVIGAAIPLVQIAALFQLFDGAQVLGAGALRGAADTRSAFYANVVGHYVVGVPVAVGLAFGGHLGGPGLWWGLCAGLAIVAFWLGARFLWLTSREIARA